MNSMQMKLELVPVPVSDYPLKFKRTVSIVYLGT
jgi:hypothetical protein